MTTTSLPPGQRLPRAVQAGLMLRCGPRFIAACKRRYGPTFTLRVASMGTLVY
ncbi:cytochrome P450, partial [Mycobacterium sp. ITM-2017-0098]